jgi:hypothetical protein
LTSCEDKIRPVANHRRQSINKAHPIPNLQLSKKRLGVIQSYLHHIKPSIGVRFKILVGDPLFFLLDGQTKGGVVVGTTYRKGKICKVAKDQEFRDRGRGRYFVWGEMERDYPSIEIQA